MDNSEEIIKSFAEQRTSQDNIVQNVDFEPKILTESAWPHQ